MLSVMPMLSVIIPAYNEEHFLGQTLEAVTKAIAEVGVEAEIIVSNDGSTDRTEQIAQEHGAQVVTVQHRQIAATRNSGAAAAKGDRLLFLDADTILPAETLRAGLQALADGAVGCGVSIQFDRKPNLFIRMMAWMITAPMRLMKCGPGCCLFADRTAFEESGGFPEEHYASEEIWFCRAMGRLGRFVMLKESVITSARKMDYHSTGRIFWMMIKLAVKGPNGTKSRKDLELWYDGQRQQPAAPGGGSGAAE